MVGFSLSDTVVMFHEWVEQVEIIPRSAQENVGGRVMHDESSESFHIDALIRPVTFSNYERVTEGMETGVQYYMAVDGEVDVDSGDTVVYRNDRYEVASKQYVPVDEFCVFYLRSVSD